MSTATGFNSSGALGTVKSVGLTMPDAFTVDNSPITESGVIEVTLEGTASQYVRGDGQLADMPIISGGGGGQVYYLNGGTSQGTIGGSAFEQLSPAAIIGAGVDFTSGTVNNVAFANFITDIGTPNQETIPAGSWIFQCYLSASNTALCEVYATVEVYDGSTFTVLSTSLHERITNGATIDLYTFTCSVAEYNPLTPTDRIAIRFYPTNLAGSRTITLHTQDSHLASIQTTFTTGLSSLNGLTKAAQYLSVGTAGTDFAISSATDTHTFNLPTASATNRGALSSADWTTFNGKQNTISLTTTGTSGAATLVGSTLNVPQYAGGLTYFTEAQNSAAPNATVNVDSLTAVASTTNADISIVPKGTGAFTLAVPNSLVAGGNKRGANAIDLQTSRTIATQVASGSQSVAIGSSNIASSDSSVSIGKSNTSSGLYSVSLGYNNIANNEGSIAIGYGSTSSNVCSVAIGQSAVASYTDSLAIGRACNASGVSSVAIGKSNSTSGKAGIVLGYAGKDYGITGRYVFSSSPCESAILIGDAQASTLIITAMTTNATLTTLVSDRTASTTASAINQLVLQDSSAMRVKGTIIAKQISTSNWASWDIDCVIGRASGVATTSLTVNNVNVVTNIPAWGTPTLVADTTNGALSVKVQGLSATNIKWVCSLNSTEVVY